MSRLRPRRVGLAAVVAGLCLSAGQASAQQTTLPAEGIRDATPRLHALTGARLVLRPGEVVDNGTVLIRDGLIEAAGANVRVPAGARVHDLAGRTLFAGFIDVMARVGLPEDMQAARPAGGLPGGGMMRAAPGPLQQQLDVPGPRHWSRRVRPERSVGESLAALGDEAKRLREIGFTVVQAAPQRGIFRGQGALLSLRDGAQAKDLLLADRVAQHLGYDIAPFGSAEYPNSLMGNIALIRQTLLDARWQSELEAAIAAGLRRERPEQNLALAALEPLLAQRQPAFIALDDELDYARFQTLRAELPFEAHFVGTGFEYRILPRLRADRPSLVLPLNFPEAPAVEQLDTALSVSLAELEHWEQAPANPARVAAAGIEFSLTTRGLDAPGTQFWERLRRAVAAGLPEERALAALTTVPARQLGQTQRLGEIAPGRIANLVVADAGLFRDAEAVIHAVWIDGVEHEIKPQSPDFRGQWALDWGARTGPARLAVGGSRERPEVKLDDAAQPARLEAGKLLVLPDAVLFGGAEGQRERLVLELDGERLLGARLLPDGSQAAFAATRTAGPEPAAPRSVSAAAQIPVLAGYPAGEYARVGLPEQPESLLIRGATLWTNTDQGLIENGELWIRRGKIAGVGRDLRVPRGTVVIEAQGRHLTPGLIDAHSHTAIARGVNEGTHAVTTEVRIADVIDPTDINLYRQLAGGLTTANLLHGSANPMGGQNAVIKLRWGSDAQGMLFDGAPPGVKFALGENVKQSNWGDAFRTRYPQSRMGVEQIMMDTFNAARAYEAEWTAWNRNRRSGPAPRRDLRLEAALEILRGERLVHIHSYRQDEILMFVRLAETYGFRVATFQHVLEGYKVAEALARSESGASTFSDWWAFKMEVMDAIPHNAALMAKVGVLTSLNSDSNELARRMNTEAAKAVRWGGLSETEALKLVTLNPARQLGIDDRVGALAVGLDADFVLWSAHPLSSFAVVEQTWIDGRRYFDRAEDRRERERIVAERERLVQKALSERMRTLQMRVAGEGAGGERPSATAGAPGLWQFRFHEGWQSHFQRARGLYHAGEELHSCSLVGHAH